MVQRRFAQIMLTALVAMIASQARAQEGEYYPHGALNNSYYQEQAEQRKSDQLERDAITKRDDYEKQKREVDRQISAHQFHIEQLKSRQAKAQEELDLLSVNLQHVHDQISQYEGEHKQLNEETEHVMAGLNAQRAEMDANQKKMEKEIAALADDRKRSEREIYGKSMEINRMKSESARLETKVAAAEAKRSALEADEMKTRTEWMQTKMQSTELQRQHDEAMGQMNDAKTRWTQAQKELSDAKADLSRTQHQRDLVVGQVKTEVERYEKEILTASKNKIASEAEQIRLTSEAEKMKDYASRIRETRDQATEQETEVNGLVLRTKVAVETARTELTQDVEGADRKNYANEKEASKRRGLAAAQDASELVGGSRIWTTNTKCKAYVSPSSGGNPVGFFESGKKLLGKDKGGNWVEISNGSGKSVFVESKCGAYQN